MQRRLPQRHHGVSLALRLSPLLTACCLFGGMTACTGSKSSKASLPPPAEGAKAPEASSAPAPVAAPAPAESAPAAPAAALPATPAGPASTVPPPAVSPGPGGAKAQMDYRLTGEVTAQRRSQVGFRVGGAIQAIVARPGISAKKGDVLATLDDRDFVLRHELAKARLASARVAADDADKEFKRELALKKDNASTAMTYDRAKAAFEQARIAVKLADIDAQAAENALKDTKLQAPYDCVVAMQLHYEGEQVQSPPPSPVFEVYDISNPEVTLTAPERLVGQIKLGSNLSVSVPSAGFSGKAKVIRLVPVIAARTRTFEVIAKFDQTDPRIVPGSYAEATVE